MRTLTATAGDTPVVGRRQARLDLPAFLRDACHAPRALVVEGEAGIGKTALWRQALQHDPHGVRLTVVTCAPAQAESSLPFAGLADLLRDVSDTTLSQLPPPQQLALQTDVVVQELTIASGGTTGWHSHPGSAIVVIQSGTFTVRSQEGSECNAQVYAAGSGFVDPGRGHRHVGQNLGTEPVVATVTYLLRRGHRHRGWT